METITLDQFSKQVGRTIDTIDRLGYTIRAKDELMFRINGAVRNERPLRLGTIACMPKLEVNQTDWGITYSYKGSGLKSAVDYYGLDFKEILDSLEGGVRIKTSLQCLIADTEARVKTDGMLRLSKDEINAKANKVVKRVSKSFPGDVLPRSEVFPVASPVYRSYFQATFLEIFNELNTSASWQLPRFQKRYDQLREAGIPRIVSRQRALRDIALQDAEYAMEGLWITYQSDWDAYLWVDPDPDDAISRMTRLVDPARFPVIIMTRNEEA